MGIKSFIYLPFILFLENSCAIIYIFVRFFYYNAGSGGAGPTILSSSIWLMGRYLTWEKIKLKSYSGMLNIDFGEWNGKNDVFLL